MTDAEIPEVVLNTREMTIQNSRKIKRSFRPSGGAVVMAIYLLFLMLPIYWLLNMSLKTNSEILGAFSLWPRNLTFENYHTILTDPSW